MSTSNNLSALNNNNKAIIALIISEIITKIELNSSNSIKKDNTTSLYVNISNPVQVREKIVQLPIITPAKKIHSKKKISNEQSLPINDRNASVKTVLTRDFKMNNHKSNLNPPILSTNNLSTKNDNEKPINDNITIESIKLMEVNKITGNFQKNLCLKKILLTIILDAKLIKPKKLTTIKSKANKYQLNSSVPNPPFLLPKPNVVTTQSINNNDASLILSKNAPMNSKISPIKSQNNSISTSISIASTEINKNAEIATNQSTPLLKPRKKTVKKAIEKYVLIIVKNF